MPSGGSLAEAALRWVRRIDGPFQASEQGDRGRGPVCRGPRVDLRQGGPPGARLGEALLPATEPGRLYRPRPLDAPGPGEPRGRDPQEGQSMRAHSFTLILDGIREATEEAAEALYGSFDDGTFSSSGGV